MKTSNPPIDTPPEYADLARVALIQNDSFQVVINRGSSDNVRHGQRFLVFGLGEEINDPVTHRSLGRLEIVRGTGKVIHIQSNLATIETDVTAPGKKVVRELNSHRSVIEAYLQALKPSVKSETEVEPPFFVPFNGVRVGEYARPV